MVELESTEKLIINELLDHEIFTSTPGPRTTKLQASAIHSFQQGYKQRRVYHFFQQLIGTQPLNFGNNLLLMIGPNTLADPEKHVFLATLKAIISSPQMDGLESDMVIDSPSVIHQVQSEVAELDETAIFRIIDDLFVKRFGLFTPDYPEGDEANQSELIDPFWDINPGFISITHELITYLTDQQDTNELTPCQRVNRVLLRERYLTPQKHRELWLQLLENKADLLASWAPLDRFRLECGEDYAVLLDGQQKKSEAKPFVVAIALANSIKESLPKTQFTAAVRQTTNRLFPGRTVSSSDVKRCLLENAMLIERGPYFEKTPVAKRFLATRDQDISTD